MSERTEVTKVVENVDRLFSEIVVNGESHVSDQYVPPELVDTPVLSTNQSEDEEEQTAEQNDEPVQGEYVKAVELNNVLHDFNDEELAERVTEVQGDITRIDGDIADINNSITGIEADIESAEGDISDLNSDVNRIDTTIGTVQTDIGRLNNRVSDVEGSVSNLQSDVTDIDSDVDTLQIDVGGLQSELTTLNNLLSTIQSRVNEINTLIPNQASAQNQLADKSFVNSSIASNTANFMGTYTSLADIEAIPNPTNNDYAFLQTTDQAGNTVYKRYKYSADTTQWLYEYDLNNSSFTAEQWATINSGLTQSSVDQSILNAVNALDVASAGGSGKYISEIQESNGKIQATEGNIASAVTSGDSSPVSSDAVAQAITDLCASAVGGSGKYIATLQQTDGKVLATEGTFSNTVQSGDYAPVTSDAVAQAIASAGVSAVDAVVSGCMSPVTSNAVANWSPANAGLANCAKLTFLDCFTAYADRPIMIACPRGSTGYSDQGVVTSGCDITYNPSTGYLKLKSNGRTACIAHMNDAYLHIYTDASAIAFNQNVLLPSACSVVTASCFCGNSLALGYTGTGYSNVTAYQDYCSFCGSPASEWASYLIFNHRCGATYYNQMIRMPFGGIPQYQRKSNGTDSGWKTFITSENIGSQSVCCACRASAVWYGSQVLCITTYREAYYIRNLTNDYIMVAPFAGQFSSQAMNNAMAKIVGRIIPPWNICSCCFYFSDQVAEVLDTHVAGVRVY